MAVVSRRKEEKEASLVCTHCHDTVLCSHIEEHPDLCCECLDLSCGKPLGLVNDERRRQKRQALDKPWPGRDESGRRQ